MASSSLVLSSLSPQTLIFPKTRNISVSLLSPCLSFKTQNKPISISSSSFLSARTHKRLSSRFVRNVVVSSDFDQEEEVSGGRRDANFSSDLKIFVGNLPFSVDSAELAGLFEQAGNVEMVEVIYDKLSGRSRGFGFVTMSTVGEVKAAVEQFNGYEIDGRPLRVNSGPPPPKDDSFSRGPREDSYSRGPREDSYSRGPREDSYSRGPRGGASSDSSNRVYVGNLSWGVDDLALETLFSEQGKVMEARVVYDRDSGRSKGFGFVTYSSAEEVNSAISSLDGVDLKGRAIRVSMAEARPRRQF